MDIANFLPGETFDLLALSGAPVGLEILDFIESSGLTALFTLDQPFYSPILVDDFFDSSQLIEEEGADGRTRYRFHAIVQGQEVTITSATIRNSIGFCSTGERNVMRRNNSFSIDEQNAMALPFLNIPTLQNRIKMTEIRDGGDLLTHIAHLVGSSIVFKTGNVNRFTAEQWEYTAAIMAKSILNWPHILFKTLRDQIDKYSACQDAGKTK